MTNWSGRNSAGETTVFYSVRAYEGNLGDAVIRAVVLEWLHASGCHLAIFAGNMSPDFLKILNIPESARIIRSSREFEKLLLSRAAVGEAVLVFAPGPEAFGVRWTDHSKQGEISQPSLGPLVTSTVNAINTLLVTLRGGRALSIGRASRGFGPISSRIERARARRMDVYMARDVVTSQVLGLEVQIIPDVAFIRLEEESSTPRPWFTISLRSDGIVPFPLIEEAVKAARDRGLEPVFVSQVVADDLRHRELAAKTGARLIDWGQRDHETQLQRVMDTYKQSQFVLSDRLHSLIFGMNLGALPIAVVHENNDKLPSTLSHVVTIPLLWTRESTWSPQLSDYFGDKQAKSRLREELQSAKAELECARQTVLDTLKLSRHN